MMDLPTIWAALICVALLAYVVLDGFDLGVGILFLTGSMQNFSFWLLEKFPALGQLG